jgi:uncharacterized protein with ACT and thioredoxin-like domain
LPLDYTYRIKVPHRTGQLAKVAGTIAEGDGLIGDVTTINVGREASVREITLEVEDRDQAERIVGMLGELEGVEVLWARDRRAAFSRAASASNCSRRVSGLRIRSRTNCPTRSSRSPAA